jgi:PIN domain
MAKKMPASFVVVIDTNAIFPKDIANIVSPKFNAIWDECLTISDLQLVVPEVVRGERLYQLVQVAKQSLENATKNFETFKKVSGLKAQTLPTIQTIQIAAEHKFDDWLKGLKAKTAPIPYENINWKRVVNDAIWRVSPFEAGTGEKDTEKGFRDCLVLETLHSIVSATKGQQVIFISGDSELRNATAHRFGSKVLAAYENLAGFASFLKLTREKKNQEYIQLILEKTPSVFFKANDPECVYIKFNLGNRLIEEYKYLLDFHFKKQTALFVLPSAAVQEGVYSPISQEKIFIDSTEFQESDEPDTWKWKTRVRCVRLFK